MLVFANKVCYNRIRKGQGKVLKTRKGKIMKYSEKLIEKTVKAINYAPCITFWNVHKRSQCNDLEFCEIRFEDADEVQMFVIFTKNEINVGIIKDEEQFSYNWFGSFNMKNNTEAMFLMWLGMKLYQMYEEARKMEER